ncbi:hypothetical protein Prudu_016734, partial [Prunus dulcis]
PDPNSALEFESDHVRARHLVNVGTNDLIALLITTYFQFSLDSYRKFGRVSPVSVTQSQPEQQTGRIQGTVVSLIRIPGFHGPGVPETREANVKYTDKLKANWMSVDIVISEGNIY